MPNMNFRGSVITSYSIHYTKLYDACQDICPANIEHVSKIIEMRRNLVLMEGEFPGEEVMTAMEQTEVNGNPLGMGYASRGEWAEALGVKS